MQVHINGLDSLLRMHGGDGCNDNGLQAILRNHFIVTFIQPNTVRLQMLLRPFNFFIVRSTYCHELCSRSAIQKVQGMALAHASETRASNLKLLRRHLQIGKGGEEEELELSEGREKSSEEKGELRKKTF